MYLCLIQLFTKSQIVSLLTITKFYNLKGNLVYIRNNKSLQRKTNIREIVNLLINLN